MAQKNLSMIGIYLTTPWSRCGLPPITATGVEMWPAFYKYRTSTQGFQSFLRCDILTLGLGKTLWILQAVPDDKRVIPPKQVTPYFLWKASDLDTRAKNIFDMK